MKRIMIEKANSFNPQDKLIPLTMKGQIREYLEVKWRVFWFRSENPDGEITTELLNLDDKRAVVQARVFTDGHCIGCGIGSETLADFIDYIEKAETKAVGRALAIAGYGTQFCTELDMDIDGKEKLVDTPIGVVIAKRMAVERDVGVREIFDSSPPQGTTSPRPMSEKQHDFIISLCTQRGENRILDPEILAQRLFSADFNSITIQQAAEMITKLKNGMNDSTEMDM